MDSRDRRREVGGERLHGTVDGWSSSPVFPLNAKKVRICEIMSGGFAVKIQQCVKSPAVFGNFFCLLKFLLFSTNCLMRGRQ